MESSKGLPDLPMPYKEREGGIPMEKKKSLLPKLFWSTLYLSAFTFGGGYVIVTLMKEKFVDRYHWIEEDEMLDLVAIAQSSPGAIAVNGAIVVGYKLAGIPGFPFFTPLSGKISLSARCSQVCRRALAPSSPPLSGIWPPA